MPEDWVVRRLEEIITIKSGNAFSSFHFSKEGLILLTPGNFRLNGGLYFNERNTKRYSGPYSSSMVFEYGDLLIVMTDLTPDCNLLGKPAFVYSDEAILHNQRIGKIVPIRKQISVSFLYWFFLSDIHASRMKETATGSTVRHTSNSSIYNSLIPVPPTKTEQQTIATALSDVEALIAALDKLIVKKHSIKTAAMQQLLTGKKRLSGFNGDWKNFAIGDLFEITAGKDLVKRGYSDNKDENHPYPIYANSVFNSGLYGYSTFKEYEGDCITVSARGTLGVAFYRPNPFVAIGRLLVLKQKEAINNYFVSEFINHRIEFASESTGVPQLTAPQIAKYNIFLPDIDEQNEIAFILFDMDAEITALESRRNKTWAIKQGMMQELLAGRTRIV